MKFLYFLLITFFSLLNGFEVKAHNHYMTYRDDEKFVFPQREGDIFICPNGATKLADFWDKWKLGKGEYNVLFDANGKNNNLNKGWNLRTSDPILNEKYGILKLNSISGLLFFVPPENEKSVSGREEVFKAYQKRLLNGDIRNINNSYKLTNIFQTFIGYEQPFLKTKVSILVFKNRQNKTVDLIGPKGYASQAGDFWLFNSKKQIYKGLRLENPVDTLICEGKNLIVRVSNTFRLNYENDLGNVVRGPLLILLRESSFELQELPKLYYETPSL